MQLYAGAREEGTRPVVERTGGGEEGDPLDSRVVTRPEVGDRDGAAVGAVRYPQRAAPGFGGGKERGAIDGDRIGWRRRPAVGSKRIVPAAVPSVTHIAP